MNLRWMGWLLLLVGTLGHPASGQPWMPAEEVLLRRLNAEEAPLVRGVLRGADVTAYPVFVGAPVVAWGIGWMQEGAWAAPYRLTLAWAGTAGGTLLVKRLVRRPRPFVTLAGLTVRARGYDRSVFGRTSYSFPSGHAAMAFAVATSVSLSWPAWYVAVPSLVWAGGVAVSRVWLGVHYPSDVLAGAVLGAGVAYGVHRLRDVLTPTALGGGEGAPVLTVRWRWR